MRGLWELYQDAHEAFVKDGIGAGRVEDASGKFLS